MSVAALATGVGSLDGRGPGSDPRIFGGRLIAADAGSLAGVRVVASDSHGTYEAVVDSMGVFVGEFDGPPVGPVTFRVFTDSLSRYHPAAVTVGAGASERPTRVVLLPTRWTIRGGAFDGRDVAIDPTQAAARLPEGAGYWRLTRRGRDAGRPVTWLADSLPVRVAFRRERQDPTISNADSLAFWSQAAELERLLGRPLFRPAAYADVEAGGDGVLVTVDRRMSAAGKTFITYDPTGRIYEALVTVSSRELLGDSRVALHELMHAVGLGHTGSWPSVMSPSTRSVSSLTPTDVAHAQLYFAVSELQRTREAPFGIPSAVRDRGPER